MRISDSSWKSFTLLATLIRLYSFYPSRSPVRLPTISNIPLPYLARIYSGRKFKFTNSYYQIFDRDVYIYIYICIYMLIFSFSPKIGWFLRINTSRNQRFKIFILQSRHISLNQHCAFTRWSSSNKIRWTEVHEGTKWKNYNGLVSTFVRMKR